MKKSQVIVPARSVNDRDMRVMRDRGVSRELYMQGCALLWENNNPTDVPVDQEV